MSLLILVSLIWAFSFGLIKTYLMGLDSSIVGFLRLGISLLCFLPFVNLSLRTLDKLKLCLLGAIQYGLMYFLYIQAYQYLKGYEVALFTITTPLWVALCGQTLNKRWFWTTWFVCILSCAGAYILVYSPQTRFDMWQGFVLVQLANICFALGQVYYKFWWKNTKLEHLQHHQVFAFLFFGATLFNALIAVYNQSLHQLTQITPQQWAVLLYLGAIASGVCFFLWNKGATQVKHSVLATLNNLKIPLSILVSILVFNESGSTLKLLLGSALILSAIALSKSSFTQD